MIRCLKCKKYLEVWDGKPPQTSERFSIEIYNNDSTYDYFIVDEYIPYTLWQKFTNIFRRKKWVIIGGIVISAQSYATAYEDSSVEVVELSGEPGSLSYQGTHFVSHAKDFVSNKHAFIDSIPVGRKIQCTSCQEIFDIKEAVKFWELREGYYGDLPLCSCGGEIMNDFITENGRMRTVFQCENCETHYDRSKFGEEAVDLIDE